MSNPKDAVRKVLDAVKADKRTSLTAPEGKLVCDAYGIPVPKEGVAKSAAEAAKIATDMGFPVVMKIVSPDIPHKTEIGGVKVGMQTRTELEAAVDDVMRNARTRCPTARIEGVLISEMVQGGFELIVGVVNDPVFGPVVVAGAGGIYAELMKDSACRIAPFDQQTALDMLDELRCRPILNGARGKAALDVAAAAKALAALSRFAWENRDRVREVDVNPLFVLPDGVVAADALIIMQDKAGAPAQKQLLAH